MKNKTRVLISDLCIVGLSAIGAWLLLGPGLFYTGVLSFDTAQQMGFWGLFLFGAFVFGFLGSRHGWLKELEKKMYQNEKKEDWEL